MTSLYILKLTRNKYYIGKSNNVSHRIQQHFAGKGAAWTKLHSPVKIITIMPTIDTFDEDKYTLEYMSKYGIDNVRGGSFCQQTLPNEARTTINRMINGAKDKCQGCGQSNHYINKCPNKSKTTKTTKPYVRPKRRLCDRCGRNSHTADMCYAKKDINNATIVDIWTCVVCENDFDIKIKMSDHEKVCSNHCKRCDRYGHVKLNCYASWHNDGHCLKI